MSLNMKLPDGTLQKIAGHTILLDANASEVREGDISIPSIPAEAATRVDVTFSDPMPDTDYAVDMSFNGDLNPIPQFSIKNKTTTGFSIYLCRPISTATPAMTAHYIAWKPVKIDGYTALQNKVNSPDSVPTEDSLNLVTSGGVWEAIKNASAVWKGTKAAWEALPATEKQTYDLAVLLDTTLVKAVDREDGTETDVANLNKIVHLTKAEYDAMPSHDPDTYYMITDDTTTMSPHYPRPDWTNSVAITAAQLNAGYDAPSDGMIVGRWVNSSSTGAAMTVNNVIVGVASNNTSGMLQCPVSSGDVIKNGGTTATSEISFVPWK